MPQSRHFCVLRFAFTVSGLAQEGAPHFTKDFPVEECSQRRRRIYEAIGPEAVALVQWAATPAGFVRSRQTNEFYYLCGAETPHA